MKVSFKPRQTHPWRNGNRETENRLAVKKQKLTLFISPHLVRLIKADCNLTGARVSRLTESLYKQYLYENGKAEELYRDVKESLNKN